MPCNETDGIMTMATSFTVNICHLIICCRHHPYTCMSVSLSLFPDDGSCMLLKRWKTVSDWLVFTKAFEMNDKVMMIGVDYE